nr:C4-dicarboxylic acid transporter DauA [Pseudomonadota bacterium]
AHLFSLRLAHALREACIRQPYTPARLRADLLAGLTVGLIAIPLAMALAVASGVAPQHGLYTAAIAGIVIAATGGSRYSVSGPTAAFVVILLPVAKAYGLGGLLLASLMAGALLVVMAFARLGRLIEYIPESVTLGFTGGIAIVIATLQIKDLLGLKTGEMPEQYLQRLWVLARSVPGFSATELLVGATTLGVLLAWPRLRTAVPAHLPAVLVAGVLAALLSAQGLEVETIGSRFHYPLPGGGVGAGIPPYLPVFGWPWSQPGPAGEPLVLGWQLFADLLPAAFAIAMLGAIESLLCAVVLDGMTGGRHSANSELLGQGIGNLVTPFFGGITATAAIARSAANVRAGAQSPLAAVVHGLVVLAALAVLAPLLAYLPMAALAGLLLVVAWNMSEAPKAARLVRTAPWGDVLVFATCLSLTVLFDMVIAITTGVLLAAVLFTREIAEMTRLREISDHRRWVATPLPEGWRVYKITGPLFFAAADRVFAELALVARGARGIVLYLDAVPILDAGGLASLNRLIESCQREGTEVYFADWQFQPLKTLARAGVRPVEGVSRFFPSLREALEAAGNVKDVGSKSSAAS